MVKRVFHDKVPVPEVFGWRVDEENYVFIYVELIHGRSLLGCWGDHSFVNKSVCQMMKTLRQLEQDPSDQYIGAPHNQEGPRLYRMYFCMCILDLFFSRVNKSLVASRLSFSKASHKVVLRQTRHYTRMLSMLPHLYKSIYRLLALSLLTPNTHLLP
jgi:hypothetical protein